MSRAARARTVSRGFAALLAAVASVACSEATTPPQVRALVISPPAGLVVDVGGTMRFHVSALGPGAVEVGTEGVEWRSADPSIVTVTDGVAVGVAAGETTILASLGGVTESVSVEVWVPEPVPGGYEPGVSYFGRNGYIEYIPGTLPVVLSAPHGGTLNPSEIAVRPDGVRVRDVNTLELTHAIRDAFVDLTGAAPHVVISHLDRSRLDPNREIVEAAQGDPFAEQAWREYHDFIESGRSRVGDFGGGMYFDIHGHGHPKNRLELGYLLGSESLNQADALLNSLSTVQMTSIREIGRDSPIPFSQLLRGPTSLGGLLEDVGVPAVPSPSDPSPGSDPYFSGGYSTFRHGSLADSEVVSGIQIEHHFTGIRDSTGNRGAYAAGLAEAIRSFMLEHFGYFEP